MPPRRTCNVLTDCNEQILDYLETILVAFEAVRLGHSISTYFELSLQIITVDLLDNITPFDL